MFLSLHACAGHLGGHGPSKYLPRHGVTKFQLPQCALMHLLARLALYQHVRLPVELQMVLLWPPRLGAAHARRCMYPSTEAILGLTHAWPFDAAIGCKCNFLPRRHMAAGRVWHRPHLPHLLHGHVFHHSLCAPSPRIWGRCAMAGSLSSHANQIGACSMKCATFATQCLGQDAKSNRRQSSAPIGAASAHNQSTPPGFKDRVHEFREGARTCRLTHISLQNHPSCLLTLLWPTPTATPNLEERGGSTSPGSSAATGNRGLYRNLGPVS